MKPKLMRKKLVLFAIKVTAMRFSPQTTHTDMALGRQRGGPWRALSAGFRSSAKPGAFQCDGNSVVQAYVPEHKIFSHITTL